ncbi:MAG: efflux RND transporter permease subunit, partial [Candidatus Kapaibacterium sp.]
MMDRIIKFALNHRLLILFGGIIFTMAGLLVVLDMDVDIFPDLNAPTVVIMTEAHGMASEEVEKLITFPIETAVNGSPNIRRVRSASSMGFSIVWAEFDWDIDRYDARQIISEKLQEVREQLPEGADNPTIAPQSSLLGEIMIFALTADSTDPMRLRTLADWEIRPRLLSVGGIAQVTIIGGESKQYQVLADPLRMRHYGVSLAEIKGALGEANHNSSGGFINEYGNKYLIRGMARTNNPAEIENNVIKIIGNSPVKISDVADVQIGAAPLIGTGAYRGRDAVVVTVSRQPDINTIKVTERINAELESIMKKLPPDVKLHNDVFNQAEFINTSIYNLNTALLEGAVLVIFILFIFLANLRTTVISVVAIPLSLMVATVALKMLGLTINTMSLGGFAIAIGSIVDDAIIDVENVYKRLKQNRRLPREERLGAARIVFEASREIRASIL